MVVVASPVVSKVAVVVTLSARLVHELHIARPAIAPND